MPTRSLRPSPAARCRRPTAEKRGRPRCVPHSRSGWIRADRPKREAHERLIRDIADAPPAKPALVGKRRDAVNASDLDVDAAGLRDELRATVRGEVRFDD